MVCLGVCIEFACWFYFVLSICADEFCREKIFIDRLLSGGRFFILRDLVLHRIEKVIRYDARHPVFDNGIAEFILADIFAVAKHRIDYVGRNGFSVLLFDSLFCQKMCDVFISLAVKIEREHFPDNGRIRFIDRKAMLVVLNIPKRHDNAVDLALERIFFHAALGLFGKFGRVRMNLWT